MYNVIPLQGQTVFFLQLLTNFLNPYQYNKIGFVHFVFKGHRSISINLNLFLSMKHLFVKANSADADEKLLYAAFHLGFHCLTMYSFTRS